jgi:hypothetical protein
MVYKCLRCGREFDNSSILRDHFNRKHKCDPILLDIDVKDININDCKIEDDRYKCEHCEKICSNKFNLEKHLKICKENNVNVNVVVICPEQQIEQLKKEIEELKKENEKMKKIIEKEILSKLLNEIINSDKF